MDLTNVSIVILASIIFVLTGMVGYLYWQQSSLLQKLQSLALVVAEIVHKEHFKTEPDPEPETKPEPEPETEVEDDRVEVVEGPPAVVETVATTDIDDYQELTVKDIRDLLTKKGIPFGKRDSKSVLLQLLRATA